MKSSLLTLTALLGMCLSLQAQNRPGTVSVFAKTDLNTGDVRVFDEATGYPLALPADLQAIRLHPIDFVGRTELLEFCGDRPRYMTDVPSASRIVLPRARGSLYKYSKQSPEGVRWGFLHIDGTGAPHSVGERLASGPGVLGDPFLTGVAISPRGDAFLAATTFEAGGDVLEISLVRDVVINRTERLPALRIQEFGIGLQRNWGMIVTERGVYRFDRSVSQVFAQGQARRLLLEGNPSWFQGDVLFSLNGEWAMFVAGASQDSSHVWAMGKSGNPTRVSVMPNRHAGAGFLPRERSGPFMAISDDGMLCAWIVETANSRELHIGRGPASGILDAEQVTRPLYFHDTLDEIGQTTFFQPDRLTFLAGANDYVHTGMNQADVFSARMPLTSTVLEVANLSKSSEELLPPFEEYGTLEPDRVLWSDFDEHFIIYDGESRNSLFSLDSTDPDAEVEVLMDGIRKLDTLIVARQGILFDVRRTPEAGGMREMYRVGRLDQASAATLVSSVSPDTEFLHPAARRDGWVTFVAVDADQNTELLSKVNMSNGAFESFAITSQSYGPALGYTHRGSVLFSLETPGATSYMLWPFGSTQAISLQASAHTGFVLPPF